MRIETVYTKIHTQIRLKIILYSGEVSRGVFKVNIPTVAKKD
jgi:hypothetical protein